MTAQVRMDFPKSPWPNWHRTVERDIEFYREKYRQEAQWTLRHLYGAGVIYEQDGTPSHPNYPPIHIIHAPQSNDPAARTTGARNVVGLEPRSSMASSRCAAEGGGHEVVLGHFGDIITAVYIPFGLSDDPNTVSLVTKSHFTPNETNETWCTWHRNPDSGLFDGCGINQDDGQLEDMLATEQTAFINAWAGEGRAANEEVKLLSRELKHATERMASETTFYDWVGCEREPFLHRQDEFIGPYQGRDQWQRLLPMHPCIPLAQLQTPQLSLVFDKATRILIEYIYLHDYWRFGGKDCSRNEIGTSNPFYQTVPFHPVCWIEVPEHARSLSKGPALLTISEGRGYLWNMPPDSLRNDSESVLLKHFSDQNELLALV